MTALFIVLMVPLGMAAWFGFGALALKINTIEYYGAAEEAWARGFAIFGGPISFFYYAAYRLANMEPREERQRAKRLKKERADIDYANELLKLKQTRDSYINKLERESGL